MRHDPSRDLLVAAAAETLARIRRDRESVPSRVRPLLAYVEQHLFEKSLDVNQLKRACGVRDNTIPIRFTATLGRTPHRYIEDHRLETARRLLRDTDLKIWQVADLVGYSSIQVFSRAYVRWSGESPSTYRESLEPRLRFGRGGWSVEDLQNLQSEVILEVLGASTQTVQREILRRLRLPGPHLVARLCEESRRSPSKSRRIELARLAVLALQAIDPARCADTVRAEWTAKAWSALAAATWAAAE